MLKAGQTVQGESDLLKMSKYWSLVSKTRGSSLLKLPVQVPFSPKSQSHMQKIERWSRKGELKGGWVVTNGVKTKLSLHFTQMHEA